MGGRLTELANSWEEMGVIEPSTLESSEQLFQITMSHLE